MEILREQDIDGFCTSAEPERNDHLSAIVSARRPSHVLPVFQLCAQIHAAARRGRLKGFRACWDRFADWHASECGEGYLVHVGDGDVDEESHARAVLELPRPKRRARDQGEDPRDGQLDGQEDVLRSRFEALHERARPKLEERVVRAPASWWWLARPPESLPGATYLEEETSSTVLDNNVFVELLNELPADGNLVRWSLPRHMAAAAERIRPALTFPYGAAGKLIVPLSVLIEAEGVTWTKQKYANARAVLVSMARDPSGILWKVFDFDDLTLKVFDAFLHLHERLDQTLVPRAHWPRLGDALVFAHGLVHRCPIASAEWTDPIEKKNTHWRQAGIDGLFPFLVLQ